MILEETLDIIKIKYAQRFDGITIEKLLAGIYYTAVKLSNGYSGVAYTNTDAADCCTHNRSKGFGDFTPGNFKGQRVADLFDHADQTRFIKTVQLSVMNALSAELLEGSDYHIIKNQDPFDLLDLNGRKRVCLVGAFLSYMKKIAESECSLQIIELNEDAVPDEFKQFLVSAEKEEEVLTKSDIVIITGSSIANFTLDDLLKAIPRTTQVILVGPTSSLLPDVLFACGVDLIGATQITDSEKMFQLIAEGAAGFHLFRYCATKICMVNES